MTIDVVLVSCFLFIYDYFLLILFLITFFSLFYYYFIMLTGDTKSVPLHSLMKLTQTNIIESASQIYFRKSFVIHLNEDTVSTLFLFVDNYIM